MTLQDLHYAISRLVIQTRKMGHSPNQYEVAGADLQNGEFFTIDAAEFAISDDREVWLHLTNKEQEKSGT